MRIIITGTPGTGKSIISTQLAKELSLDLVDLKEIARGKNLKNKKHEVGIKNLARVMAFLKNKKNYLVEGHLACEFRMPCDIIIVLRCHPKTLKTRLKKRKYGEKKINENLLVEMLDYCTQLVLQNYKCKPIELDTSKRSIGKCILLIKSAIKTKKSIDRVSWKKELENFIKRKIRC